MSDPPMPAFICNTCGTQFAPSEREPLRCPICDEERQFVPPSGQVWTTHEALARRHTNTFRQHEPGLIGIGMVPAFAIGQRALLLRTPKGNVLWDCISLLDGATKEIVEGRGALLSGDIVQVIPDRKFVTFMRSYPNMIPLSAPSVERIGALLEPYKYDVIHGAWFDRTIPRGGKDVVTRSVARYIAAVRGDGSAELK